MNFEFIYKWKLDSNWDEYEFCFSFIRFSRCTFPEKWYCVWCTYSTYKPQNIYFCIKCCWGSGDAAGIKLNEEKYGMKPRWGRPFFSTQRNVSLGKLLTEICHQISYSFSHKSYKKYITQQRATKNLPLSYIHEAFLILNNVLLLVLVAEHVVIVRSSPVWCCFVVPEMRLEFVVIELLRKFPEADRLETMVLLWVHAVRSDWVHPIEWMVRIFLG